MQDRFFIAAQLRQIAGLLQIKGENPFKARAYERAADALERLDGDLDALVTSRRLTDIKGVGAGLAAAIDELYRTGKSAMLERLREELPPGVVEISSVPGLNLKKIVALHAALGSENLSDLKAAGEKGLIRTVKGLGEKAEAKILAAIGRLETREDRVSLDRALKEGERLVRHLRAAPEIAEADIAGVLRRRKETVRRIVFVAASRSSKKALDRFLNFPAVAQSLERAADRCSARLAGGLHVELNVVAPEDYAGALHYFTGSKKHYARLEELARRKKITLGPRAPRAAAGKKIAAQDEKQIYRRLGMRYVPPELREDEGEIEAALAGELPDLVTIDDIQGMTHCHTVYSDGKSTVEEMARAAEVMGMKYLTITDHSPNAFYARGVKIDRLMAQWEEIDKVQEKVKIKLLKGTESDILDDGALDYPDRILERFDIVIASIHHRAKMDAGQMTRRIVRAMRQPIFKIWGHPLGRLIQSRPPLECDMEKALDAVAESGAAIEVNGDPRRLDLEPRWIRAARRRGIKFIVSTDAHSTLALQNLRYGVFMARRGWLTRGEVLNTLDTRAFREAVRP
ncbi:MAG TPA: DNA polymerase/3'-5' exonuclease PolX [Candidatus Binatia bacterium]|jgi:DNA polymerase (family 10)